jgi:hypothetical protein
MQRACLLLTQAALIFAPVVCQAQPAGSGHDHAPGAASQAPPLAKSVDLRPVFQEMGLGPRRQGGRPTCSVFTVTVAIEFAVAKRQGHGTRLSVEFLNWAANKACGDTEDGAFFSDLWKGFEKYGISQEEQMPYRAKLEPDLSPPEAALAEAKTRLDLGLRLHWIKEWNVNTGLTEAQVDAIKATLHQGWPVCGGFRWPKQERWVDEVLQMCPSNSVRDGHSVLLVGYRDDTTQPGGGVFLFRNTSRGGQDGFMPYAYAREFMNDAVWVDFASKSGPRAAAKPASRLSVPATLRAEHGRLDLLSQVHLP